VGGYVGQYRLAGARTYAALRRDELRWVRLADPAAGRVDDFQIGADGRVDAHQVKWSRFAGTLSFRDFTREQPDAPSYVAQLADGWTRLRRVHTGARVVVHFVSNDLPSTADRLPSAGRGRSDRAGTSAGTFAAFLAECWEPARAAAAAGADVDAVVLPRWRPAWEALRQAAGLAADDWPAFVRDCELEFGTPSLDAAAAAADWRTDVDALVTLLQRLVADPAQRVEFSRDELLDALGWRGRVEYRHRHEFPDPDIPYRAVTSTVQALHDAIAAFHSGYVALVGTPGSGKSTLLTRTLRYAPERVIRYYAYVPTSVGPNVRRGEASHFLHDLVVALERQGVRAGPTLPIEDVARLAERDAETALRAVVALDARGLRDEARTVFSLAEPMDVLGAPTPIEYHQLREVRSQLTAWVEVAPRFRRAQGLIAVIGRLQVADERFMRQHRAQRGQDHTREVPGVDADLTAELRGTLLRALVDALNELGRPDEADAVRAYLFDSAIADGSAWFWTAVDGWRHAHSVGDYPRAQQRLHAMRDGLARWSGGALDTDETAALAEGLVRVVGDAHAARALVDLLPQPAPVSALTASGSDDGFGPYQYRRPDARRPTGRVPVRHACAPLARL
jgi:hypothetical protein